MASLKVQCMAKLTKDMSFPEIVEHMNINQSFKDSFRRSPDMIKSTISKHNHEIVDSRLDLSDDDWAIMFDSILTGVSYKYGVVLDDADEIVEGPKPSCLIRDPEFYLDNYDRVHRYHFPIHGLIPKKNTQGYFVEFHDETRSLKTRVFFYSKDISDQIKQHVVSVMVKYFYYRLHEKVGHDEYSYCAFTDTEVEDCPLISFGLLDHRYDPYIMEFEGIPEIKSLEIYLASILSFEDKSWAKMYLEYIPLTSHEKCRVGLSVKVIPFTI